eukprot:8127781-Karenia_brevis.AAC.1
MPTRAKVVKEQLVISPPTAKERLGELQHQVEVHRGRLTCHRCGQSWADKSHYIGHGKCPGPEMW